MTIEQLNYFITIVKVGSYQKAALELNLSQSSLSKHIIKMESELNVKLFNRSHRTIILTEDGKIAFNYALEIVKSYRKLINALSSQENDLTIGILPIHNQFQLGKSFNEFKKKHPCVNLHLLNIEERDLQKCLLENKCDIYVLRGEFEQLKEYPFYCFEQDEVVAVLSEDHPLAKKDCLDITDLLNEKLLTLPKYTTIYKVIYNACVQHGFSPDIAYTGRENILVCFSREKAGVALLTKESIASLNTTGLKIVNFKSPIITSLYLYILNPKKDSVKKFFEFFKTFVSFEKH